MHHFAYPPPAATPFIPPPTPIGARDDGQSSFSAFPAPSYAAAPVHQHFYQPQFDGRLPPVPRQYQQYAPHYAQYPPPPPQHSFDQPPDQHRTQRQSASQPEIDPSLMDGDGAAPVAGVPDGVELGEDDAEGELEDDVDMQ